MRRPMVLAYLDLSEDWLRTITPYLTSYCKNTRAGRWYYRPELDLFLTLRREVDLTAISAARVIQAMREGIIETAKIGEGQAVPSEAAGVRRGRRDDGAGEWHR